MNTPHTLVTLTAAERRSHEEKVDRWLLTLQAQAADSSDPETQANALALLASRT